MRLGKIFPFFGGKNHKSSEADETSTYESSSADRTRTPFSERLKWADRDFAKDWSKNSATDWENVGRVSPTAGAKSKTGKKTGTKADIQAKFAPLHPHDFHHAHDRNTDDGFRPSRSLVFDLTRLMAAVFVAGLFGLMILKPTGSRSVVKQLVAANPLNAGSLSERACRQGQSILTADFTNYDNVLSISPLGGVTAPGEVLPVPYIRINTKNDGNPFTRRITPALAPATADVIAIERRLVSMVGKNGKTIFKPSWTVHMRPCADVGIVYDRLDAISPSLVDKAGGLASFSEIGGPDHIAKKTAIRVSAGMELGQGHGFDVALHDFAAEDQALARPERYRRNPYARAELFNVSPDLIASISPDHSKARCALDYLRTEDRDAWSRKLGDAWGIRRAKGDNACRTALIDLPGTAQGAWYTDAAHNGATIKVSAIALAPDTINPDRLIFALHGKLPSLNAGMIGTPALSLDDFDKLATDGKLLPAQVTEDETLEGSGSISSLPALAETDFLTFQKGNGMVNRPFDEIRDNEIYCYENMRVNFIGPRVRGVFLLQKTDTDPVGAAARPNSGSLKIEARADFLSCDQVPSSVTLTDKATGFFR